MNASMGLIVAAPTAGSSGVLPGLLLALEEEFSLDDEQIIDGLFTASAIGYLIMRNASVAEPRLAVRPRWGQPLLWQPPQLHKSWEEHHSSAWMQPPPLLLIYWTCL